MMMRRALFLCLCLTVALAHGVELRSRWPEDVTRVWIGPEYWANRLQDWRIADGRLECTTSGANRNLGLITVQIGPEPAPFRFSARLGRIGDAGEGHAALRVGGHGRLFGIDGLTDYRDDVMRGRGLDCGVATDGTVFIGNRPPPTPRYPHRGIARKGWKIHKVDSTQGGDEAPKFAIDGRADTYWHSRYGSPPYPHEFQLNLGAEHEVCGVVYVARQDMQIGRIRRYRVYVSSDPETWGDAVKEGEFADATGPQEVRFAARRGRYVRLEALSDYAGRPAAVIAELFVLNPATADAAVPALPPDRPAFDPADLVAELVGTPQDGQCRLRLTVRTGGTGDLVGTATRTVPWERVQGALALVSHADRARNRGAGTGGNCRFWFRGVSAAGPALTGGPEQRFGPILWSQYTLTGSLLKLTAQMPPVGEQDADVVRLETRTADGRWVERARVGIDPLARTARFRLTNWDASRDTPYRLLYGYATVDGVVDDVWSGTIRRDPVGKNPLVVAAFTGNADYAFPNVDLVKHVAMHDPDLLFFSGDNIYEQVAGFGVERSPLERACLDYLRKWYCYGWAYRDLMRDRPCISLPDDHDVYQGNIWGQGGRKTDRDTKGGYIMQAEWVNVVQRTQCSHFPDPYDPTPVEQDIAVYYCGFTYGRVGFAVLEDRKFKSGPLGLVPPTGGRPDHITDPDFDPKNADVPGAVLLGKRQLDFLTDWAGDWRGTDMKATLSQTVFAGAATHHGGGLNYLVADCDSNGWPQSGRNRALDRIRRGFAFMIGGDQHLATIIHHGIDDWNDAGWSFLVPSVANLYPRAWMPPKPPVRTIPGLPEHMGEYTDGFGNKVSVYAATNPGPMGVEPRWLHDKKPGYGIIRFDKVERTVTMECWPRFSVPETPGAAQYTGWPRTVTQLDQYGRQAVAYLPEVVVQGAPNAVVRVLDEPDGDLVYALRTPGSNFRPKVFADGTYTLRVGDPDRDVWKTFTSVASGPAGDGRTVTVALPRQ